MQSVSENNFKCFKTGVNTPEQCFRTWADTFRLVLFAALPATGLNTQGIFPDGDERLSFSR